MSINNPNIMERIVNIEKRLDQIELMLKRILNILEGSPYKPRPPGPPEPFPPGPGPRPEPFRF
ncbi:MAG: hypothetical protein ACTSVV_16075 [Promethearchaeota archaeon]